MSWFKRPPYGITHWTYHVRPWLDQLPVWLNPNRFNCCGRRKPFHKMACTHER